MMPYEEESKGLGGPTMVRALSRGVSRAHHCAQREVPPTNKILSLCMTPPTIHEVDDSFNIELNHQRRSFT